MYKQIPGVIYGWECYFSQRKGKEKLFGFSRKNGELSNKRSFKLKELFTAEKVRQKVSTEANVKKVNKIKLFACKKKREKFCVRIKDGKKVLQEGGKEKVSMRFSWIKRWLNACDKKDVLLFQMTTLIQIKAKHSSSCSLKTKTNVWKMKTFFHCDNLPMERDLSLMHAPSIVCWNW